MPVQDRVGFIERALILCDQVAFLVGLNVIGEIRTQFAAEVRRGVHEQTFCGVRVLGMPLPRYGGKRMVANAWWQTRERAFATCNLDSVERAAWKGDDCGSVRSAADAPLTPSGRYVQAHCLGVLRGAIKPWPPP
jgi:hypothetical protein